MTKAQFLTDVSKILTGEHPDFRGDRYISVEAYIRVFSKTAPSLAHSIGDMIIGDMDSAVNISELHPDRIRSIVAMIRKHNPLDHKDNY